MNSFKFQFSKPLIKIFLLSFALFFIFTGIKRGEAGVVLSKAVRICLECVGIG